MSAALERLRAILATAEGLGTAEAESMVLAVQLGGPTCIKCPRPMPQAVMTRYPICRPCWEKMPEAERPGIGEGIELMAEAERAGAPVPT